MDVMARGAGIAGIWLPCVILLGMAALTYLVGVTRFKFE
jgi:hypothetical protein